MVALFERQVPLYRTATEHFLPADRLFGEERRFSVLETCNQVFSVSLARQLFPK